MRKRWLVLWMVGALSGCGGGGGGSDGGGGGGGGGGDIATDIQGTWAYCFAESSTTSFGSVVTISGSSWGAVYTFHANGSCAGAGTPDGTSGGTLSLGAAVTATLGGSTVTAHELDLNDGTGTEYSIVYVNTATNPDRMYLGDTSGANDGTTPALRPTVLDPAYISRR